jgi:multicomponent Na+:H+ antiporter subunit G
MDTVVTILDAVRVALGGLICTLGLIFLLGGAIGMLRFPDFYTRLHAASVAEATGAAVFAAGLAVMAPDLGMAVRLLLLGALVVALGPVFSHVLASSAHAGGLAPIAGQYTAPRPGGGRPRDRTP